MSRCLGVIFLVQTQVTGKLLRHACASQEEICDSRSVLLLILNPSGWVSAASLRTCKLLSVAITALLALKDCHIGTLCGIEVSKCLSDRKNRHWNSRMQNRSDQCERAVRPNDRMIIRKSMHSLHAKRFVSHIKMNEAQGSQGDTPTRIKALN